MGEPHELDALAKYLGSVAHIPKTPPKALLVVSAHWEERVPTVMSHAQPPMLYDYSGFPPESYTITWPAPGEPQLAQRVRSLLKAAGIESGEDKTRGFDHGTFVPLKVAYPKAHLPTVQLSLRAGLDPKEHLAMGRALAPLRDEGIFIIGSGMSFHNMRAFRMSQQAIPSAAAFDEWLQHTVTGPAKSRDDHLATWEHAPAARLSHPREEHLLPLMVIAGAAGDDIGKVGYRGTFLGLKLSAFHFG
jgi:aromatic ring-opening dioxygenase catalytic subunit (LigB family)